MTRHCLTLAVAPLLLALAASAQTPPVHQVQVQQATIQEGDVPQDLPEREAPEGPLTFAEVMPTFPGGEAAYKSYLQKNIVYPASAREANIRGKVYIEFVVEKDGSITNVKTLRGIGGAPELENEALRVVKTMPKWNPGKQAGQIVAVIMHLPIAFELQP